MNWESLILFYVYATAGIQWGERKEEWGEINRMRNEGPVHLLVAEISAILRIYTDELLMMPFPFL